MLGKAEVETAKRISLVFSHQDWGKLDKTQAWHIKEYLEGLLVDDKEPRAQKASNVTKKLSLFLQMNFVGKDQTTYHQEKDYGLAMHQKEPSCW